ncbi:uncharacterized protein PRCAT00002946001 [Priceomyces carsonii]|uniref:uncharacterized protein n=1 Tax=Priceomyces carsonii TaxID=28549 RepID=UPI002ED97D47|nr:unnamed protein product [Priceomyces carsonii]
MSKRAAAGQITRETLGRDEESSDEANHNSRASVDVMSKRKILKPRGRSNGPKSHLNGFGGSTFSNVGKQVASVSSATDSKNSFSDGDKNEKVRALNDKFVETINRLNAQGTIADFSSVASKYIEYYKKIQSGDIKTLIDEKQPLNGNILGNSGAPNPVGGPKSISDSDSDSNSEQDIKIEGPKFQLTSKPVSKNSPFTFGPKSTKEKLASDSDSEVEIKGPIFQFNKPISDRIFKFDSSNNANPSLSYPNSSKPSTDSVTENKSLSAFSFGEGKDKNSIPKFGFHETSQPSKAAFSFTSNKEADSATPSSTEKTKPSGNKDDKLDKPRGETASLRFSFGDNSSKKAEDLAFKPSTVDNHKPAFSFGSIKTHERSEPSFSFGPNSNNNLTESDAVNVKDSSKFTFGNNPQSDAQKSENMQKPAFSFGSINENKDKPKPAFSFGSNNEIGSASQTSSPFTSNKENKDASKPAFSFGAKDGNQPTTAFSFGKASTTNLKTDGNLNSGFSFTGSANQKTEKPAAVLDSLAENPVNDKPSFSFGSSSQTSDSQGPSNEKKGLFGSNSLTEKKPVFQFSFGKLNDSQSTTDTESSHKPTENDNTPTKDDLETMGGDFEPVAKLPENNVAVETGEENESILFSKRAKLMFFDPSNKEQPYSNRGVGELKILKSNETHKSRILIRADGGLRIILNTLVSRDMTYAKIGNGSMVRVPTVNPETKAIDTYVVKVKTPSDGEELFNTLNNVES